MNNALVPFIGYGNLNLGMHIDELRKVLGPPGLEQDLGEGMRRSWHAGETIRTTYDRNGIVGEITVKSDLRPVLFGKALSIEQRLPELERWARGFDPNIYTDSTTIASDALGFALYFLDYEDDFLGLAQVWWPLSESTYLFQAPQHSNDMR
jgi:hypothetical protein